MSQLLLINPRRRRAKSAKRRHRARRRMTAKQLRFFGQRRRRHSTAVYANPRKRRRSRRASARRSYRRSFRRMSGAVRASLPGVLSTVKAGFVGGAGAIAVDALYAQAGRILPASVMSRYNADGSLNLTYYGAKAAVAIGAGLAVQRFVPGARGMAAQAIAGSFTVMAYEILRTYMPAGVPLGYFNPALVTESGNVTSMGKYLSQRPARLSGLRKYVSGGAGGSLVTQGPNPTFAMRDTRIGEGQVF